MKANQTVMKTAGLKGAALSVVLLLALCGLLNGAQTVVAGESSPALTAQVDESAPNTTPKTEVVYAKLSSEGQLQNTYVVNTLEPDATGVVTDYGSYQAVQNLTDASALGSADGAVTMDISEQAAGHSFSYQGDLGAEPVPWNVAVSYALDGKDVSAKELAGASGNLELTLKIAQNKTVSDKDFFNNYLVTATVTLDSAKARNIKSDDAQIAMAGSNVQLTFMVMPGKEATLSATAVVENFEMSSISVAAIPFAIALDFPSTDDLISQFSQLTDAAQTLHSGATALAAGAGDLAGGMTQLSEGATSVASGAGEIAQGAQKLAAGVEDLAAGAGELAAGAEELSTGAQGIAQGAQDLQEGAQGVAQGTQGVAQGVSAYQQGLNDQAAQIGAASDAMGSMESLQAAYAGAFQEYMTVYATAYAQTYAPAFAQAYEEALQGGATEEVAAQQATGAATQAAVQAASAAAADYQEGIQTALSNIAYKASYTGSYQALSGAAAGVGSAEDQNTLLGGATAVASGAAQLAGGVDEFATGAGDFADGVGQLSEGTAQLSEGTAQLSEGTTQLSQGTSELSQGASQYADGVNTAAKGAQEYAQGASQYADGMGTFQTETQGIPSRIQREIDSMMSEYDKSDFAPRSFVSSKNTNVKLVQFVMDIEGVSLPKEEKQTEEEPELTPLDRLFALFK